MGRGSSPGNTAAAARRNTAAAISVHPRVTEQFDADMGDHDKMVWAQRTFEGALDDDEIKAAFEGIEAYSDLAYSTMRNNAADPRTKAVDKMLENSKAPVYDGEIYRGLVIMSKNGKNAVDQVWDAIKTGVWNEPGLTSYSTKKSVAEKTSFGNIKSSDKNSVSVIIVDKSNQTGVPIQHLSVFGSHEAEVLKPSSIRDRGSKILSYKWSKNKYGHPICTLTVSENTQPRKGKKVKK